MTPPPTYEVYISSICDVNPQRSRRSSSHLTTTTSNNSSRGEVPTTLTRVATVDVTIEVVERQQTNSVSELARFTPRSSAQAVDMGPDIDEAAIDDGTAVAATVSVRWTIGESDNNDDEPATTCYQQAASSTCAPALQGVE